MITDLDIQTTRQLLADYAQKPAIQALMDEVEYVSRKLGDISRNRAARLIIATRQNTPTNQLLRRRTRN